MLSVQKMGTLWEHSNRVFRGAKQGFESLPLRTSLRKHSNMFKLYMNYTLKILIFILHTIVYGDQIDFEFDGWSRQCYLFKPSCIPEEIPEDFEGVPLIIMLHGIGGEGADWYGLSDLAEDSCFVAAFPQGMYDTWNAGENYGHDIDDVSYLEVLLDTIHYHIPLIQIKFMLRVGQWEVLWLAILIVPVIVLLLFLQVEVA